VLAIAFTIGRRDRVEASTGEARALVELLSLLFIGWHPDDVFFRLVSVDMAELIIVFGTIAASLGALVAFGNWWSR
jgi:hypothetical protein